MGMPYPRTKISIEVESSAVSIELDDKDKDGRPDITVTGKIPLPFHDFEFSSKPMNVPSDQVESLVFNLVKLAVNMSGGAGAAAALSGAIAVAKAALPK